MVAQLPLAVNLMPDGPPARVAELAALAESVGAARCWVYDEGMHTRDVHVTLAAVAQRTERLGLGPGITNPFVRHPGATASAIATLDELSGGRAALGLGAGGALTLGPLGIDRHRPVTAVEATVRAVRALFAGDRVDADEGPVRFRGASLPYGRPGIEIVLAGRGRRMTALGAALADGFNLSYVHKDLLGAHVAALRAGAGDRPFRIAYSTMVVTTDEGLARAREQLTFRLVDSPPEVAERLGLGPSRIRALRSALADGGPPAAAHLIEPDWVTQFVIAGEADACGAELRRLLADNDLDEFQLPLASVDGADELIERAATMVRG